MPAAKVTARSVSTNWADAVSSVSLISALYHSRLDFAIREWENRGRFGRGLGRLVVVDGAYAVAAAAATAFVAPRAQGSGLPEMKGFLNGSRIPGLFRFRTLVVKFLAIARRTVR